MAKVTLELDIDWAMLKNQMNKLSKWMHLKESSI